MLHKDKESFSRWYKNIKTGPTASPWPRYNKMNTKTPKTQKVVVVKDACHCSVCNCSNQWIVASKEKAESIEIKSVASGDWEELAKRLRNQTLYKCHYCGALYKAFVNLIPIRRASFSCSMCDNRQRVFYEIKRVKFFSMQCFKFYVYLVCSNCEEKTCLDKLVRNFYNVTGIEVRPSGIVIRKNQNSPAGKDLIPTPVN